MINYLCQTGVRFWFDKIKIDANILFDIQTQEATIPNWCENAVTFTHKDPAAIKRVAEAFATGHFMSQFFPCPKELKETISGSFGDDNEQRDLELKQAANQLKYGFPTWYEWSIANWGTKWDVGDKNFKPELNEGDTSITLSFESAWGPPTAFYEKMTDELGYSIKAYYYEPGMAFCGIWNDGEYESYKIPMTSDEVADKIPAAIDEMFNIVGRMEEWEEETAEEEVAE